MRKLMCQSLFTLVFGISCFGSSGTARAADLPDVQDSATFESGHTGHIISVPSGTNEISFNNNWRSDPRPARLDPAISPSYDLGAAIIAAVDFCTTVGRDPTVCLSTLIPSALRVGSP